MIRSFQTRPLPPAFTPSPSMIFCNAARVSSESDSSINDFASSRIFCASCSSIMFNGANFAFAID